MKTFQRSLSGNGLHERTDQEFLRTGDVCGFRGESGRIRQCGPRGKTDRRIPCGKNVDIYIMRIQSNWQLKQN